MPSVAHHYINQDGSFAGSWYDWENDDGSVVASNRPSGLTEVPSMPSVAGQIWNGSTWTLPAAVDALTKLQQNDSTMFRALELLIDVLLAKGTIVATDFPPVVRTLYLQRKALRVAAGVP